MEAALTAIKNFATAADETVRRKLMVTLHELAYSLEDSNDTVHRLGYLVRIELCPGTAPCSGARQLIRRSISKPPRPRRASTSACSSTLWRPAVL